LLGDDQHIAQPQLLLDRSFTGRPAPLAVRTSYERHGTGLTGNVQVLLHNKSPEPVRVTIKDNSYKSDAVTRKIAPGQKTSVVLSLKRNHGWYDFTVQADGSNQQARYAGRVESGMPGFSDPLMAGVTQAT
jgi:phospholipase C